MVDGEVGRARRAWGPDELEIDDTAAGGVSRARRGAVEPVAGGAQPAAGLGDEPEVPAASNPFARPGSEDAWAPVPAEPAEAPVTPIPAPVLPRSAGSLFHGPAPRRSALSTTSPTEGTEPAGAEPHWFDIHRSRLLIWAVGGLVAALVIALIAFLAVRAARNDEGPVTAPSASSSPSGPTTPATLADLLTGGDLAGIAPAASWAEVSTTESVEEHQSFAICLSKDIAAQVNPTRSLQRSLGTAGDTGLAALHQIDVYANDASATTVMDARIEALSSCAEVPVVIEGSSTITGLAERTFQITVLDQGQKDGVAQDAYHTVLLTQQGPVLQLVDGKQLNEPVAADALALALVRPQTALDKAQGVEAPPAPTVAAAVVPAVEPLGWLIASDLPRVRSGAGRWQARAPQPVSIPGTGCENMTLASESGPSERQETRYTLTQDDQAPTLFGLDQLLFTFDNPTAASQFITRLGNNIATCKNRVLTATVAEGTAVVSDGADGATASTRLFTVTQAQGDNAAATFQVLVGVSGTHVGYAVVTTEGDYKFSDSQLSALAQRLGVRLTQA